MRVTSPPNLQETDSQEQEQEQHRQASLQTRAAFSSAIAHRVRLRCLAVTSSSEFGHLGPDFSAADLISALYAGVLRKPCVQSEHPDRDRFILSKGHAALALYSVLIELGWWPASILDNYGRLDGALAGHPSAHSPGIETCTGALGHGLPFAVGAALAARLHRSDRRTFVLTGDGELQEGSNWEAAMLAATHGLDNLTVIVDRNGLQQGRATESVCRLEPLADKWRAFGWSVMEVDGHSAEQILACLDGLPLQKGRPSCILARTRKGKGVSFMEGQAAWHHKLPTSAEAELAFRELGAAAAHE
ncbi:transketolase [Ramlibacter tataouinensis]|uniref:Transketolase N-terminal domain-containing protein n=1 Tax=Ramlibacter tataouinensis (strain ATCC BAA-407 / DSM 14655 / LMG 21543 / TTB310) TaxID=365046 RepID=F5XXB9_RAMTT|nr:transketolase [Ramlibacter tataouinensis]AEG94254.1 conserved hypothetical protein [Ramlibacter tataouinensis TTB310]